MVYSIVDGINKNLIWFLILKNNSGIVGRARLFWTGAVLDSGHLEMLLKLEFIFGQIWVTM